MWTIDGFFPNDIVAFKVPVESCLGTTGEREPLGEDFGEYCSTFLNWSLMMSSVNTKFYEKQLFPTQILNLD